VLSIGPRISGWELWPSDLRDLVEALGEDFGEVTIMASMSRWPRRLDVREYPGIDELVGEANGRDIPGLWLIAGHPKSGAGEGSLEIRFLPLLADVWTSTDTPTLSVSKALARKVICRHRRWRGLIPIGLSLVLLFVALVWINVPGPWDQGDVVRRILPGMLMAAGLLPLVSAVYERFDAVTVHSKERPPRSLAGTFGASPVGVLLAALDWRQILNNLAAGILGTLLGFVAGHALR
jgi:hypothetical protein